MFAPKSILVPTDFSECSDRAIQQALDLAVQNKAKLYLLHVIEGIQPCAADYCIPEELVLKYNDESKKNALVKMKNEAEKIVRSQQGIEIAYDVKAGIAYDEILHEQEDRNIDLIVIASHGRSGIVKHLIGSVAEKVMRGAKCPVLLVR